MLRKLVIPAVVIALSMLLFVGHASAQAVTESRLKALLVTADDISDLPLITFEQLRPQKLIEGSLRAAGAHVRVVTRMSDYASVLSMVSAGLGCGLVPRLAVDAEAGAARLAGLRFLPLDDQPPRLIGLAWNRQRSDEERVRQVVELAADVARGVSYRQARATSWSMPSAASGGAS